MKMKKGKWDTFDVILNEVWKMLDPGPELFRRQVLFGLYPTFESFVLGFAQK